MDKLQTDMQKMMKETEMLIARRLPVAAGKFAKQHFQNDFLKGLFGGIPADGLADQLQVFHKRVLFLLATHLMVLRI